jgi:predicted transcriptional regulator of viral defense system
MYRINELIKLDRKLYHSQDLAILWNISNKNTLYTTIKRYVKKGILISLYKGLYSTVPVSQLDPYELGRAIIHRYAYLSTESVLVQKGIIFQALYGYSFVSDISKKVTIGKNNYIFRQLSEKYLTNSAGIEDHNGIYIASTERAIADMLYFNPKYHFDLNPQIDWNKVKQIQQEVGY